MSRCLQARHVTLVDQLRTGEFQHDVYIYSERVLHLALRHEAKTHLCVTCGHIICGIVWTYSRAQGGPGASWKLVTKRKAQLWTARLGTDGDAGWVPTESNWVAISLNCIGEGCSIIYISDGSNRCFFRCPYRLHYGATGTGTFGRVRLVRHVENRKYYALKISKKASILRMKQVSSMLAC